jgi:hypothetical protein
MEDGWGARYACRVTVGGAAGNAAAEASYNDYETFAAAYARQ